MQAQAARSFDKSLSFGRVGEGRIARWLMSRGYAILPVYEKEINEGKGPQLFMLDRSLIAPDMLAFRGNEDVRWIEAKRKSVFTWHRKTERWVTGIDLKHYRNYLEVALRSPWPVYLLFLHESGDTTEGPGPCPTGLFGHELLWLADHENHQHANWGKGGMVYWAHEDLQHYASLETFKKLGL